MEFRMKTTKECFGAYLVCIVFGMSRMYICYVYCVNLCLKCVFSGYEERTKNSNSSSSNQKKESKKIN